MSATLFTCSELKQTTFIADNESLENAKDEEFGIVLNRFSKKSKAAKTNDSNNSTRFAIKSGSNIVKIMNSNDLEEFLDKYAPMDEYYDTLELREVLHSAAEDLEGIYISKEVAMECQNFEEQFIKDLGEYTGMRILNEDCLQVYTGEDMERESLRKVTLDSEQKRCLADFEKTDIQEELDKELKNSEFVPMPGSENWVAELIEEGIKEREARGEAPPTITINGTEVTLPNPTGASTDTANSTVSLDNKTNDSENVIKEFDWGRRSTGRIAEFMNSSADFFTKLGINFDKNANDFGRNMNERKDNMVKSLETLKTNISESFSDFSFQITKKWDNLSTSIKSFKNPFKRTERTEVNNQTGTINLNIFNFSSSDISEDITNQIKNSIVKEEKKLINVANFQSNNGNIGIENAALSLFIGKDNQIFLGNVQIADLND